MENFQDGCPHPVVKIGQYPVPRPMLRRLMDECETVLILEEGAPVIEEQLRGLLDVSFNIRGRLDGTVPRAGELNPNIVARALGRDVQTGSPQPSIVKPRPPELCPGCPHIDSYNALNEALKDLEPGRVFSDIGCYTLGALEPFNAINSCVDMGASITMAKGAADAGLFPSVAVIGDSTFTHSGMTGLLDAIIEDSPITVMIVDNETTGMTGGQASAARGRLEDICAGLGVPREHIRVIEPHRKNHEANVKAVKEELYHRGVSVVIERRECIQTIKIAKKAVAAEEAA